MDSDAEGTRGWAWVGARGEPRDVVVKTSARGRDKVDVNEGAEEGTRERRGEILREPQGC